MANKEPKFLVDLKNRVFLSAKPHQDIIDENDLDPAGYDNYFKGWVTDAKAKFWVDHLEDLVFRYWDQARMAFRALVDGEWLTRTSKLYAIVNGRDEAAGVVADVLGGGASAFADSLIGTAKNLDLKGHLKAGQLFRIRTTLRIGPNRFLWKDTPGRLVRDVRNAHPRTLPIRWERTVDGFKKKAAGTVQSVDVRILLPR
jgi:hypothetical protein